MPQLSPMSWVVVFLFFLVCWVMLVVKFWWGVGGEYKISGGTIKLGSVNSFGVGWKFNGSLKPSK
uniref:ATP synthase F0 subunit 8 n=1 Tax=Lamprotula leaii TaxID=1903488 RepID=V9INS0_9BIVA|nr:ATP synthase F0 subunit 8 [Lamprotula leaii]AFC97502.1 ATP synthase F0 subunit 8 [Lamprotula leaii]